MEQQIGHLVRILKHGKNKPIGTLEITTQTYFTVLLRARISGRCGRKENKKTIPSILPTDSYPKHSSK